MKDSSELKIASLRIMSNEDGLTWEERREKALEIISSLAGTDDIAIGYSLLDWLINEEVKAAKLRGGIE